MVQAYYNKKKAGGMWRQNFLRILQATKSIFIRFYPSNVIFRVDKISSAVLRKEIVKRCRIEGQRGDLVKIARQP